MANLTVRIRSATPNDAETVIAFSKAMALETEGKTLDPESIALGVRRGLADPKRSNYFVAEIDGETVGQIMVTWEWSDWRNGFFWWIQSVYVDPPYRRRGVFRALHAHVRDLAVQDPNVCGIRLYVHRDNQAAIRTYEQLGMSQTEYLVCEEVWPSDPSRPA